VRTYLLIEKEKLNKKTAATATALFKLQEKKIELKINKLPND
jgi:hypothetical protein